MIFSKLMKNPDDSLPLIISEKIDTSHANSHLLL